MYMAVSDWKLDHPSIEAPLQEVSNLTPVSFLAC
jgi:hypothetical protein